MTEDKEAIYARTMRVGVGSAIDEEGVRDVLALAFPLSTDEEMRVVMTITEERIDAIIAAMVDIKTYLQTRVPPPGSYWDALRPPP